MSKLFTLKIDPSEDAFLWINKVNGKLNRPGFKNPWSKSFIRYLIFGNSAYMIFDLNTWHFFDLPRWLYIMGIKRGLSKSGYKGNKPQILDTRASYKLLESVFFNNEFVRDQKRNEQ